ncbi:hypothetical protein RHA1_ro09078 (plasmid) [Rhodococcus jostii RHA1]|uniref:Uncharacterized protein n=1 Tax=Rhodococcus jostii (strain RHA1) TaxID=101510 RepID=Q0RX64_RHOJR|nr:hypothetical protein RHA1_ro09078 [Rhodococcus jostii RHA1]
MATACRRARPRLPPPGVLLSAVAAILLGDLSGVSCQPGQLPRLIIPRQQIRPPALRPADTHQRPPRIPHRLPQPLTRGRPHVTHSTATHRTYARSRPASPTSNTRTHRALTTPRRRSLLCRWRSSGGSFAVDSIGQARSAPTGPKPGLECAFFERACLHRRPPAVSTTRERHLAWAIFQRGGRAADLPFSRTGTRRIRSPNLYWLAAIGADTAPQKSVNLVDSFTRSKARGDISDAHNPGTPTRNHTARLERAASRTHTA